MSEQIEVWQPSSKHFQTENFVVLNEDGPLKMTRGQYEMRLLGRLKEAVQEAENEQKGSAYEILTGSPENNPDLYRIGMEAYPPDYPSLILSCDQMQMLLNQIDWNKPGRNLHLDKSDLPSLREICETIPS